MPIAYERDDIAAVYEAARFAVGEVSRTEAGKSAKAFPKRFAHVAPEVGPFLRYLGEATGLAYGETATQTLPIEAFRISILTSAGSRVGSVTVGKEALTALMVETGTKERQGSQFVEFE